MRQFWNGRGNGEEMARKTLRHCVTGIILKNQQNLSGELKQVEVSIHGFHPCHFYVCSVPPPQLDMCIVKFSDVTVLNLK